MKIFWSAFIQSDLFGKSIFFVLFGLSCVSWIYITLKLIELKKITRSSKLFENFFSLQRNNLFTLKSSCQSPYACLFSVCKNEALELLDKNQKVSSSSLNYLSKTDIDYIESRLYFTMQKLRNDMDKYSAILPTIISLAPFLGLLGTVWGILITFSAMNQAQSILSNTLIFNGLSMALATTVMGLLIAIPALVGNNLIKAILQTYTTNIGNFCSILISNIELQYKKVDISL